jgi:hypothetical protein
MLNRRRPLENSGMNRLAKAGILVALTLGFGVAATLLLSRVMLPRELAMAYCAAPSYSYCDGASCHCDAFDGKRSMDGVRGFCGTASCDAAFSDEAGDEARPRLLPVPERESSDATAEAKPLVAENGLRVFDDHCRPVFATGNDAMASAQNETNLRSDSDLKNADAPKPTPAPPQSRRPVLDRQVILIQVEAEPLHSAE